MCQSSMQLGFLFFYFFMNSVMLTQPCEAGSFITFTEKATERLSNLPKVTQV